MIFMPEDARAAKNDFNPTNLAPTVNKHDQDIIDVKKRVDALEKKFGSHEKIADTLYETAQKQIKMEEMFSMVFKKLIEKDSKIKSALDTLITQSQEASWRTFLSQGGRYIYGAVIFTAGVVVTVLVTKWLT